MLMVAYAGWKPLAASYAARVSSLAVRGVFTVPTWPFRAIIIGGALLAAVVLLLQTLRNCASSAVGEPDHGPITIGFILIAVMVVLIILGMHIGFVCCWRSARSASG